MSDWNTEKEAFIQWKGTDVCLDLHCPKCAYHNHYDGYFAYYVQCGKCLQIYKLPEFLTFIAVDSVPADHCQPLIGDYDAEIDG